MLPVSLFAFLFPRHPHHGLLFYATPEDDVACARLLEGLPPRAERMGRPPYRPGRRAAVGTQPAGTGQRENRPNVEPTAGHFARRRVRSAERLANLERAFSRCGGFSSDGGRLRGSRPARSRDPRWPQRYGPATLRQADFHLHCVGFTRPGMKGYIS